MRLIVRLLIVLFAAAGLAGSAGCSDAYIANRDDQHTPSVPPAQWENNPLNMPQQSQNGRVY